MERKRGKGKTGRGREGNGRKGKRSDGGRENSWDHNLILKVTIYSIVFKIIVIVKYVPTSVLHTEIFFYLYPSFTEAINACMLYIDVDKQSYILIRNQPETSLNNTAN